MISGWRPKRCSIWRAGRRNSWWSESRSCQEKVPGMEISSRNSRNSCWRLRPRRDGRRWMFSSGPRAIFSRTHVAQLDHPRSFGFVSHLRLPGPGCWPTSWPRASTSTRPPGSWRAARVRSNWSSSTGSGAGSAIPKARAGFLRAGVRRPASTPSLRRAKAAGHPDRASVYMSDQSHSANIRAARIIGVKPERIRLLPSDGDFRLDMGALARAVAEDRAAGLPPHRGVRQRRSDQHGGGRSARGDGGFL